MGTVFLACLEQTHYIHLCDYFLLAIHVPGGMLERDKRSGGSTAPGSPLRHILETKRARKDDAQESQLHDVHPDTIIHPAPARRRATAFTWRAHHRQPARHGLQADKSSSQCARRRILQLVV